jgi:stage II sporulation protein D
VHRIGDRAYPGSIRITAHPQGGLRVENSVELEEYVAGVVAGELSIWSALPAELQAQSIAARSYALASIGRSSAAGGPGYLRDDVLDQVYRGRYQPGPGRGAQDVARRLHGAVAQTAGMVLYQQGRILDARFHAACGGRGSKLTDIFPDAYPFESPPTSCPPCLVLGAQERDGAGPGEFRGKVAWRAEFRREELADLARALGIGESVISIEPLELDLSGRWLKVRLRGPRALSEIRMEDLRLRLGRERVQSARVVSSNGAKVGETLVLSGLGRGHGVGMCQTGCRELARSGWSAARILLHYYPNATLERRP